MTDKEHKSEHPGISFEEVWRSLEENDKTGVYKQAREMADLAVEQLEYAYNSGYKTAKAKYSRPQGKWIKQGVYFECPFCHCGCNSIITDKIVFGRLNYCPNCGADMRGDNNGKSSN